MKTIFGLIFLCSSFSALAQNTDAVLFLRGYVPLKYEVEVTLESQGPRVQVKTNSKTKTTLPLTKILKHNGGYLVSVTHP
jgi:hypothetical protein